ncbi:putative ABC transport system permease protein [Halopseudomonas xinjiangensis]|uniref:Putative ABC transport system permease protein n=1 Tax=Halopseudomonas xinjiangensis TaxID=487184 RepID=A0A1H1SSA5_9GAMM|nr:FtsX-like permease family protein [Halopseudomonas xinjiangensis]SDS50805.1 putative ABC transport system permease protein [Halopseudomonas xinjiangensis]
MPSERIGRLLWMLRFAITDLRSRISVLKIFLACLILGVTLVAATASLYRVIEESLLADTRAILGGDVELEANEPLPDEVLAWIRSTGTISLVRELDTIVSDADGENFFSSEILIADAAYPLYGELQLTPDQPRSELTAQQEGLWGAIVDPLLAERLGQTIGDHIQIGAATFRISGLIQAQPDRSLNANWRGLPIMLSDAGLQATELISPASRVDYEYRVQTDRDLNAWLDEFERAFPDTRWDVTTFAERSERLAERLNQIATALILIAFTTLFIGGLGVANSIHAYLEEKLGTIATLQTLGLRRRPLVGVYLLQIGLLGSLAGIIGGVVGLVLSALAIYLAGDSFALSSPVGAAQWMTLWTLPLLLSWLFAVLTAYVFALPALARALAASPAGLFRGKVQAAAHEPRSWRLASYVLLAVYIAALLVWLPSSQLGFLFLLALVVLWGLLEALIKGLRIAARALENGGFADRHFARRLALANLHRPDSPLRATLLSLGTALTLVVACTLLVSTLLRALESTIPAEAPALILYDVLPDQIDAVETGLASLDPASQTELLPLVRGRLAAINEEPIAEVLANDSRARREAMGDEYKLSYLSGNPEDLELVAGDWWASAAPAGEPAFMAMEDREANELGLAVGDRMDFLVEGQTVAAEIKAIYRQKGLQTRFWFEGVLQDGALDALIGRYVGVVYQRDAAAKRSQQWLARNIPNVITLRTADWLETAGALLSKATAGLAAIALVSLTASLLVLSSVVSVSRRRQLYEANLLHCLGARHRAIRFAMLLESALLVFISTLFATLLGALIALPLAALLLKLPAGDLWWLGALVAGTVSSLALLGGLLPTLKALRQNQALLLREG